MVVRIRLARLSRANQPLYNIVIAQPRTARDSKPMEVLGTYDPTPRTPLSSHDTPEKVLDPITQTMVPYKPRRYKDVQLDITRTKYWLGVGAQPSEGVQGLLTMLGLWEPKPQKAKKMMSKNLNERGTMQQQQQSEPQRDAETNS